MKIYTAGYAGWTVPQLRAKVEELNALLVDIRYCPRSRRPEWDQESLQRTIPRYIWLKAFGNVNYQDGPIKLANAALAVASLRPILATRPVLLLCACRDVATCHRRDAADFLSEHTDCPVEHLSPPERHEGMAAGQIPALTVRQPWAWALFHGKPVENRSWPTKYRGPLAIHAASGCTQREYRDATFYCASRGVTVPAYADLVRGAIIGTATLVDCVRACLFRSW